MGSLHIYILVYRLVMRDLLAVFVHCLNVLQEAGGQAHILWMRNNEFFASLFCSLLKLGLNVLDLQTWSAWICTQKRLCWKSSGAMWSWYMHKFRDCVGNSHQSRVSLSPLVTVVSTTVCLLHSHPAAPCPLLLVCCCPPCHVALLACSTYFVN